MRTQIASPDEVLNLGKQGENKVTEIKFDISGWSELYGSGYFELINCRPTERSAYLCDITTDSEYVHWVITSTDVALSGVGQCELSYIVNDAVAKSITYLTCVIQSVEVGDAPDPMDSWITEVKQYMLDSEAYALGTKYGVDVPSTDPTYHNNSKYFAQIASSIKVYYATNNDTFATIERAIEYGFIPVAKYDIINGDIQYTGTAVYGNLTTDSENNSQQYNLYDCTGYELVTISFKVTEVGGNSEYTFDSTITPLLTEEPVENSTLYISSGGVYDAIESVGNLLISKGLITQEEWDSR